jgi:hypothetical protein
LEVLELRGVFRRHDETELVPITPSPLLERGEIDTPSSRTS